MSIERTALGLVGDVYGLLEIDEFRTGLLSALREAVPSDWVSLNEVGSTPEEIFSIVEPPLDPRWHQIWTQYGLQNPLVVRFAETRDGRASRLKRTRTRPSPSPQSPRAGRATGCTGQSKTLR